MSSSSSSSSTLDNNSSMKIELVQVLFRHGARTCMPLEIAAMPHHVDNTLLVTYGSQQLTKRGGSQMYKLGRALRSRYYDFLVKDRNKNHEVIHARSTDYDRTKMSLQLVLAGIYSPVMVDKDDTLDWLAIPFFTVPKELDYLMLMFDKSRYKEAYRKLEKELLNGGLKKSSAFVEIRRFFADKDVDKLKEPNSLLPIFLCQNVLEIHKNENCKLPDWYTPEIHATLRELSCIFLDAMSGSVELKKLLSGTLVRQLIDNMSDDLKNPRKIYLYSGHDFTLAGFLRAHELYDDEMRLPGFGSSVIVEKLRDARGRAFVRLLAWSGKGDDFFVLKLKNHDEVCPYEEYVKIVDDVLPTDDELKEWCDDFVVDLKKINTTDFVFRSNSSNVTLL